MSNGKSYPDETKAAVMAALLAGQSISSVAREYKIPKGTVSDWNKIAHEVGIQATQKKELKPIGDALIELLATEIQTLVEISKATRHVGWVHKQSAADLAVYTGVKHDKLIRMLEAFGNSTENTSTPD